MLGSIRSGLKMKLLIMLTAIFAGDAGYCFYILHKGASLKDAIRLETNYRGFSPYATFGTWTKTALAKFLYYVRTN